MVLKKRSTFFYYPNDDVSTNDALFEDIVEQDDNSITIPHIDGKLLSRQEKIYLDYKSMKLEWRRIVKEIGLFHIYYNIDDFRPNVEFQETIFTEDYYLPKGLNINSAPQTAKSMEEYEEKANRFADSTLIDLLKIQSESDVLDKPTFYREWFRNAIFRDTKFQTSKEKSADAALLFKNLWNSLTLTRLDFKYGFSDEELENLTGFEFIFNEKSDEAPSIILYWKEIDNSQNSIVISKTNQDIPFREVGFFQLKREVSDLENYGVQGKRFIINNVVDTKEFKEKDEIEKAKSDIFEKNKNLFLDPTLFYIMPMHRSIPKYVSNHKILKPSGMHPVYEISLSEQELSKTLDNRYKRLNLELINEKLSGSEYLKCNFEVNIDLPKDIFLDKYQLMNDKSFTNVDVVNNADLELPSYKVDNWGQSATLQLDFNEIIENDFKFEIPLHLRYGEPTLNEDGLPLRDIQFPQFDTYWRCNYIDPKATDEIIQEIESVKRSLFYQTRLTYQLLHGDNTLFYHIRNNGSSENGTYSNYIKTYVPVGNISSDAETVELVTLIVVVTSAFYLIKRLFL
ncbi:hypothetical protein B5S32_g1745 [[Candida] boidinii]|nr:hypothetical protein B5S32_g1745 [[Candida] boidinii]